MSTNQPFRLIRGEKDMDKIALCRLYADLLTTKDTERSDAARETLEEAGWGDQADTVGTYDRDLLKERTRFFEFGTIEMGKFHSLTAVTRLAEKGGAGPEPLNDVARGDTAFVLGQGESVQRTDGAVRLVGWRGWIEQGRIPRFVVGFQNGITGRGGKLPEPKEFSSVRAIGWWFFVGLDENSAYMRVQVGDEKAMAEYEEQFGAELLRKFVPFKTPERSAGRRLGIGLREASGDSD